MKLRSLLPTLMIIALGACESPDQASETMAPATEVIEAPVTEVLTEEEAAEIEALNTAMSSGDFYKDKHKADETIAKSAALQTDLDEAYKRWEQLE